MALFPFPGIRIAVNIHKILAGQNFPPGFLTGGWNRFIQIELHRVIHLRACGLHVSSQIGEILIRKTHFRCTWHP